MAIKGAKKSRGGLASGDLKKTEKETNKLLREKRSVRPRVSKKNRKKRKAKGRKEKSV